MSTSDITNTPPTQGTSGAGESNQTNSVTGPKGSAGTFKNSAPISGLKETMSDEEWQEELLLLAQNFCTEIKKQNDKVVKAMKKSREN